MNIWSPKNICPLLPSHFLSGSPSQMFEAPPGPRWGRRRGMGVGGADDGEAESGTHIPNKVTSRAERIGSSWIPVCRLRCLRSSRAPALPRSCPMEPRRECRVRAPRFSVSREEREGPRGRGRGRKEEIRETSHSGRTRQTGSGQGGAGSGAPEWGAGSWREGSCRGLGCHGPEVKGGEPETPCALGRRLDVRDPGSPGP